MSEGPIKRWRDGYKVPRASTTQTTAIHGTGAARGLPYCGRKSNNVDVDWDEVTCADCHAALLADIKEGERRS